MITVGSNLTNNYLNLCLGKKYLDICINEKHFIQSIIIYTAIACVINMYHSLLLIWYQGRVYVSAYCEKGINISMYL